jgi:NAD(P)-dependent dehydrogenase (short-subunit alcohol dehydrogenase family)
MSQVPAGAARIFDVEGRVALVTGGGSGLGRAMADALAECGAHVVVADRDQARLDRVAAAHEPYAHTETLLVDVSDATAVDAAVEQVAGRHGRVDAVFANAGVGGGGNPGSEQGMLANLDVPTWRALLEVNLHGVVYTLRAAARQMKRQGSGSIVVTASTAGLRADPFVSYSYAAAKAAVINITRQAALDLARWGVRVNAIAPGPFQTAIGGEGPIAPEVDAKWSATVPLGRMGRPPEVAGLALLLASDASSFMTGGVYPIDGGALLQAPPLPLEHGAD